MAALIGHRAWRVPGFTLIEVLVALFIVAIALAALGRTGVQSLRTQSELEQRTFALWVAENRLAELRLSVPLQAGSSSGSSALAGRQWNWRALIQPAPGDSLWRIDVVVVDDDGQPLFTHVGFVER